MNTKVLFVFAAVGLMIGSGYAYAAQAAPARPAVSTAHGGVLATQVADTPEKSVPGDTQFEWEKEWNSSPALRSFEMERRHGVSRGASPLWMDSLSH